MNSSHAQAQRLGREPTLKPDSETTQRWLMSTIMRLSVTNADVRGVPGAQRARLARPLSS